MLAQHRFCFKVLLEAIVTLSDCNNVYTVGSSYKKQLVCQIFVLIVRAVPEIQANKVSFLVVVSRQKKNEKNNRVSWGLWFPIHLYSCSDFDSPQSMLLTPLWNKRCSRWTGTSRKFFILRVKREWHFLLLACRIWHFFSGSVINLRLWLFEWHEEAAYGILWNETVFCETAHFAASLPRTLQNKNKRTLQTKQNAMRAQVYEKAWNLLPALLDHKHGASDDSDDGFTPSWIQLHGQDRSRRASGSGDHS